MRFKRNRAAMFGLVVVIAAFLMAVFAYELAPDHSPDANEQNLPLAMMPPGYKILMLHLHKPNNALRERGLLQNFFMGRPSPLESVPILDNFRLKQDMMYVSAYKGPNGRPEERSYYYIDILKTDTTGEIPPYHKTYADIKSNPKWYDDFRRNQRNNVFEVLLGYQRFWLGTDRFGRDILSRLIIGTRISLFVGLISVLISLLIGVVAGAMAGYYRGWVDAVILWIINVFWSVPTVLLAMGLYIGAGSLIQSKLMLIFIAVGLTMWVEVARIVRGQFILVREFEYVTAAQSLGFSHARTIFRHILPNIMGPVIVVACANFANAILIESGLSYIGLGVQPPTPSWGGMLSEYKNFIDSDKAFLALAPGIAIMILVLAFNLVGNGLRDALDVKGKPE